MRCSARVDGVPATRQSEGQATPVSAAPTPPPSFGPGAVALDERRVSGLTLLLEAGADGGRLLDDEGSLVCDGLCGADGLDQGLEVVVQHGGGWWWCTHCSHCAIALRAHEASVRTERRVSESRARGGGGGEGEAGTSRDARTSGGTHVCWLILAVERDKQRARATPSSRCRGTRTGPRRARREPTTTTTTSLPRVSLNLSLCALQTCFLLVDRTGHHTSRGRIHTRARPGAEELSTTTKACNATRLVPPRLLPIRRLRPIRRRLRPIRRLRMVAIRRLRVPVRVRVAVHGLRRVRRAHDGARRVLERLADEPEGVDHLWVGRAGRGSVGGLRARARRGGEERATHAGDPACGGGRRAGRPSASAFAALCFWPADLRRAHDSRTAPPVRPPAVLDALRKDSSRTEDPQQHVDDDVARAHSLAEAEREGQRRDEAAGRGVSLSVLVHRDESRTT